MTRDRVPGPQRRLLRERSRLVAIGLLAATALASSGLQAGAIAALRATLDANWRGAYDILVTSMDAEPPVDGMLPPNALGSAGGLSLDDVDAVREVAGVEVAAPLGEIAVPSLQFVHPRMVIPVEAADIGDSARAFRLTVEYTTDDGLGERVVARQEFEIVADGSLPQASLEPVPGCTAEGSSFNDVPITDADRYPALSAWFCRARPQLNGVYQDYGGGSWGSSGEDVDGILEFAIDRAPQTVTRIVLVDPEAERALLGDRAAFLDPLIALAPTETTGPVEITEWAREDGGTFGRAFLDQQARNSAADGYPPSVLADLRLLYADNGKDWDVEFASGFGSTYLPLVVAEAAPASLGARVSIEDFGSVSRTRGGPGNAYDPALAEPGEFGFPYDLPEALTSGQPGNPVGTSVADLSALLNPFVDTQPKILWPGADDALADVVPVYNSLGVPGSARVTTAPFTVTEDGILLSAEGYRTPSYPTPGGGMPDYFGLRGDPEALGVESAYGGFASTSTPMTGGYGVIPIGSFTTDGLASGDDVASYVPLGAYQELGVTLVGGEYAGATLEPSVTGLGLVSPRTVAIGSLASVTGWSDREPVSAIRVRVADIAGYSTSAQERVVAVAQAIEELGFRATIVAGSSPSPQQVRVLDYAFGTVDGGTQRVGELGTIEQNWSELGAAARAELSLSAATLAGLAIAIASAVVLLGAVQLAGIPGRRVQASALRELGFPRRRIARWYLAEELPALVGLAVVAALAVWLSGASTLSLQTIGVAGSAAVAFSVVAVVLGSRPARLARIRRRRSNRRGVPSVAAFGARQVVLHPLASTLHLAGILLVGLSGGALAAGLLRGREGSGRSILARLLSDTLLVPQIALGVVGVVAGIALVVLVRRIDLRRRARQWQTLHAAGWTSGQLALAQRVEGLLVVVPAILAALAAAWFGTPALAPDVEPWIVAVVAGACAVATAAVSILVAREGTRR
jgi:hypothetical protein